MQSFESNFRHGFGVVSLILAVAVFTTIFGLAASEAEGPAPALEPFSQSVQQNGISINFEIAHMGVPAEARKSFQEGDPVLIRFAIADSVTNGPIQGVNPVAWLDLQRNNEIPAANSCEVKVQKFLTGGLFSRAALDLNDYYVLTLNDDATISVVDPLFGFGTTKLLALIPLAANGYDWVATRDSTRMFVSIPDKNQIAVVDTVTWEVTKYLDAGFKPTRLALQPDGAYLWVAGGGDAQSSCAAFRTGSLELAARLTIGKGSHAITASSDSNLVFITNGEDNSVSVIDTRELKSVTDLPVGRGPAAIAYSGLANSVYVSLTDAGAVAAIDAKRVNVTKTIAADPGVAEIACAPGGRYVFVLNRKNDLVQVIDCSLNEIVQAGHVGKAPFQISFTNDFAYVNHIGTADVSMISLAAIGRKGSPLSVVTFPGGQQALGATSTNSPAARVVQASGENAVLVANAPDKQVYYYKEGMAAPMGSFSNYGRQALAIHVVDHSLRERTSRGVYETVARLPVPGHYDVVFFLDSPKLVHCFNFTVESNPAIEAERNAGKVVVNVLGPQTPARLGQELTFKFRIVNQANRQPVTGLTDVVISTFLAPGTWHRRDVAKEEGDGVYSIEFSPPQPGIYYGHIQCSSVDLQFGNPNYITVRVLPKDL
jgi:YVTN family beta-propeller protein